MPIQTTTVYTRERLLRFSRYMAASKWYMWPILIVDLLAVGVMCVLDYLTYQTVSAGWATLFVVILAMGILLAIMLWVVPPLTVKKANNLDAVVEMSFGEESVTYTAGGMHVTESGEFKYPMFLKYVKNHTELYLYISKQNLFHECLFSRRLHQTNDLFRFIKILLADHRFYQAIA